MALIEWRQCVGDCTVLGIDLNPIPCQIISMMITAIIAFVFVISIYTIIKIIQWRWKKWKKK